MIFGIHWMMVQWPQPVWWLRWSRNLLFLIGIFLLSYVGWVQIGAMVFQANQSRRFDQALRSMSPSPGSSEHLHPAVLPSVPAKPYPEGALVGRIEITRIGLEVMILEGIHEGTLQKAVGHFPDTPLPGQNGNVAIAGHRNTFFSGLRHIRQDDEIMLTTFSGSYCYQVDSTKVVTPETIEVLNNRGGDILTLVTCYPFNYVGPAPKRFIVCAHRIH